MPRAAAIQTGMMEGITTYREFSRGESLGAKLRMLSRKGVIASLSTRKDIMSSSDWISFPYYHHVFDDERDGFERQLRFLGNYGDFISMDQAHELIAAEEPITGRYFCVSFDDGYHNCYSNMVEITSRLRVPVMIFLPTDYIGLELDDPAQRKMIEQFHPSDPKPFRFLNWKECSEMLAHQVSFGSHTCSHANLSLLEAGDIERELRTSRQVIEQNLGRPCVHFACPWGRTHVDFDPEVTTLVAARSGYRTFATTDRGKMRQGDDPYRLKRDHLLANWENFQLKYFFGK